MHTMDIPLTTELVWAMAIGGVGAVGIIGTYMVITLEKVLKPFE